jgi:hypothetical protein
MTYLVDTSAWVRHFARRDSFDLRSHCEPDERVLCLPIYQEILQGIRDDAAYRRVKEALDAAVIVDDPLDRELCIHAATLYRIARRQGLTVRSSANCLIGASAIRHGLTVLHSDRDFTALARISELRQQEV